MTPVAPPLPTPPTLVVEQYGDQTWLVAMSPSGTRMQLARFTGARAVEIYTDCTGRALLVAREVGRAGI